MKKFLFFSLILMAFLGFENHLNAQSFGGSSFNQKTDDGILMAYPNPTKDVLMLKSKNNLVKIKSVAFFSILGAQVAEYNINSNYAEIRLDRLQAGKYLMRYSMSDDTQKITQIIKQ